MNMSTLRSSSSMPAQLHRAFLWRRDFFKPNDGRRARSESAGSPCVAPIRGPEFVKHRVPLDNRSGDRLSARVEPQIGPTTGSMSGNFFFFFRQHETGRYSKAHQCTNRRPRVSSAVKGTKGLHLPTWPRALGTTAVARMAGPTRSCGRDSSGRSRLGRTDGRQWFPSAFRGSAREGACAFRRVYFTLSERPPKQSSVRGGPAARATQLMDYWRDRFRKVAERSPTSGGSEYPLGAGVTPRKRSSAHGSDCRMIRGILRAPPAEGVWVVMGDVM